MPMVQPADAKAFEQFPELPFRIKHELVGNPLLTLPEIVKLVRELPRDQIEYNSGKAEIGQDPTKVQAVDLSPEEVVKSIETAGAWMVLKRVDRHPAYKNILEQALLSVAKARGHASLDDAGFEDIQGFLFVSSPNSTTPFHTDAEDNFFVQIHGEKFFAVYDNRDHSIASVEELESSATKHRNIKYDPKFDAKGVKHHLFPGDGVFVPYQWPHWVRTADSHSISLAITWKTKAVRRRNDLYVFNSFLRGMGLPQAAPEAHPALDALKLAMMRTVQATVSPLRKSEGMRRMLRRLVLGKNANYYYNDNKEQDDQAAA
ncbi:MAG: cupin-like domain-containing protein [Xanthobacteraceae bacterium]|nr:cupin-like domain-containing protein [Xanthobacteraceae bacterium]